ncbi:MAG: hypothetical protein WB711_03430 [Terriglobales bacterium]
MRRRARTPAVAWAVLAVALPSGASSSARQQPESSSAHARASSGSQTYQTTSIEYKNAQYGFCFTLPKSWKGYSILVDRWRGSDNNGPHGAETVTTGPIISIRHPQWTSADPRQDIPIMVFTISQWNALLKDKFVVSAAPIGPGELGRNRRYVFALPPRFDWAFPTGYQEVEQILTGKPLHAGCTS